MPHARPAPYVRQRGFGSLVLALLMLSMAALLSLAYLQLRPSAAPLSAEQQAQALQQAQQALDAFASGHGRYPCPASSLGGGEDCAGAAKGWLPVATLHDFSGNGLEPEPRMRYLVSRGDAKADLAQASELFVPSLETGEPLPAYATVLSSLDLCSKLQAMAPPADTAQRWSMADASARPEVKGTQARVLADAGSATPARTVAYALAVGRPDAPPGQSGVNADAGQPAMESPARERSAQYSDMVLARDPRAAFHDLGCGATLASLDAMASSRTLVDWAAALMAGNQHNVRDTTKTLVQFTLADTFCLSATTIELVNGIAETAKNMALLITAQLGLPATAAEVLSYQQAVLHGMLGEAKSLVDETLGIAMVAADTTEITGYNVLGQRSRGLQRWTTPELLVEKADQTGVSHD